MLMTMGETLLLREKRGERAWIAPVLTLTLAVVLALALAVVVRAGRVGVWEKVGRERETILLAGAGPGRWRGGGAYQARRSPAGPAYCAD
jgi:hypothetical protein